jgi:hypothetical protein
MMGKITCLAVPLFVLGAGVAAAQTPNRNEEKASAGVHGLLLVDIQQREPAAARYEDIEIMRRLLQGKLEKLFTSGAGIRWLLQENAPLNFLQGRLESWNTGAADLSNRLNGLEFLRKGPLSDPNPPQGDLGLRHYFLDASGNRGWSEELAPLDVEGSYLPGYGIVYTVTLPPLPRKPKSEGSKAASKPLTDWERIRKQLHGEEQPEKGAQAPAPAEEPSLTDMILKALYENGHHLRLNETDKLTVAITFRRLKPQRVHVTAANPDGGVVLTGRLSLSDKADLTSSAVTPLQTAELSTDAAKTPSSVHDYLLLGDLHLRQGQANEAINAYRSALNILSPTASDNQTLSQLLEFHRKLSLPGTDLEKVRGEIELLDKRQAAQPGHSAKHAETKLPAKLLITVSKDLLEAVGAGRFSFEDFKKGVTIEELTFSKGIAASSSSGSSGSK